jgi:hypothetical protein
MHEEDAYYSILHHAANGVKGEGRKLLTGRLP